VHLRYYLAEFAEFFLDLEIFHREVVEKIETHFLGSKTVFLENLAV